MLNILYFPHIFLIFRILTRNSSWVLLYHTAIIPPFPTVLVASLNPEGSISHNSMTTTIHNTLIQNLGQMVRQRKDVMPEAALIKIIQVSYKTHPTGKELNIIKITPYRKAQCLQLELSWDTRVLLQTKIMCPLTILLFLATVLPRSPSVIIMRFYYSVVLSI